MANCRDDCCKIAVHYPCHAFKLNIFGVTYNKELKPLEGISEARYREKNVFAKMQEKLLLRKKKVIKLR